MQKKITFVHGLCLVVLFFLEFWLLSYRDSMTILRSGVPDEAMVLDAMGGFEQFLSHPLDASMPSGFPGPYGHPFWFTVVLGKQLALLLGLNPLLSLIALFLAFKYFAAWSVFGTLRQRYSNATASAASLGLFLSPLLFFYGKILSPEYLLLLVTCLGISHLLGSRPRSMEKSIACFFVATYIKISLLPFLCAAVLSYALANGRHKAWTRLLATSLVLIAAAWVACWVAGGTKATLDSILALPTPPAIWTLPHLWSNISSENIYSWDQVYLLSLLNGAPYFFVVLFLLAVTLLLKWRQMSSDHIAVPAALLCCAALALLLLMQAKSLSWSWYLLVPVSAFCTAALAWMAPSWNGKWLVAILACTTLAGLPQAWTNVRIERDKRDHMLLQQTQSPALASQARRLCGPDALVIFDALIPYAPVAADQGHTEMLSVATQRQDVRATIAAAKAFVIVGQRTYGTPERPSVIVFRDILPALSKKQITTFPGIDFWLSPACRQVGQADLAAPEK